MLAPNEYPHCVYRFYDKVGTLLYVGCTANLFQRLVGHRSQSVFHDQIASVIVEHFDSRAAARVVETEHITNLLPAYNVEHNSAVNAYGDWQAVVAKARAAGRAS